MITYEDFKKHLIQEKLSDNTIRSYLIYYQNFMKYCIDRKIDPDMIEHVNDYAKSKKKAPAFGFANQYISAMGSSVKLIYDNLDYYKQSFDPFTYQEVFDRLSYISPQKRDAKKERLILILISYFKINVEQISNIINLGLEPIDKSNVRASFTFSDATQEFIIFNNQTVLVWIYEYLYDLEKNEDELLLKNRFGNHYNASCFLRIVKKYFGDTATINQLLKSYFHY